MTLFTSLVVLLLTFPAVANAGGWWQITASDTVGSGIWSEQDDNSGYGSPHGGFSSSSNLCKTCHAVHMAGENSYRMLKSGNTTETRTQGEGTGTIAAVDGMGNARATECMYCHDATSGATSKKPYEMATLPGETVRGEHSLGVTVVPDSNINNLGQDQGILGRRDPATGQGRVLQCWQCHSVHGSNTIGDTYDSSDGLENWNTKILRLNPANDNSILAMGTGGMTEAELTSNPAAVRTGFCADCHNLNPNWEVNSDDTTRPNNRSHPQGPGADGYLEVYGEATVGVALHLGEKQGCRGCHTASDGGDLPGESRFPHQSRGWKLLWDTYTTTGTGDMAGGPNRTLPGMDKVCLYCHPINDIEEYGGYAEVEQAACYRCHNLSNSTAYKNGAPDIATQFAKASRHPTEVYGDRHTEGESTPSISSGNRHAECLDCHNMERIVQGSGNPLRGMWGATVGDETTNTVPTLSKITYVSAQWQLCFKCHSSYVNQPTSNLYEDPEDTFIQQGNKAFEFNTKNSAYHPVRTFGRNQSSNLKQQLAAAFPDELMDNSRTVGTISVTINCTDCHNTDETSSTLGSTSKFTGSAAIGPHGAKNNSRLSAPNTLILRAFYWTGYKNETTASEPVWAGPPAGLETDEVVELCFRCHNYNKLVGQQWWSNGARTNFYQGDSTTAPEMFAKGNLHYYHFVVGRQDDFKLTCRNCHYNIHSNQDARNTEYEHNKSGSFVTTDTPPDGVKTHLINFSPDVVERGGNAKPHWMIDISTRVRRCNLTCHGQNMTDVGYRSPEGDDNLTY